MKRALLTLLLATLTFSAAAQQHINQQKGFNAENVYSTHDIDVVNLFNGNLTVSIPIGPTFPIANGLSYGLVLHGNSNLWDMVIDGEDSDYNPTNTARGGGIASEWEGACTPLNGITMAVPHRRTNAGLGWILTMGRLFDPNDRTSGGNWVYESPDGADHLFFQTLHEAVPGDPDNTDGVMYTRDGTYLRMKWDADGTRTIEFPDGTFHKFEAPAGEGPWMPTQIRNRFNANWLNIQYRNPYPEEKEPGETIDTETAFVWVLTDNHQREHKIFFKRYDWNRGRRLMVDRVVLMAFGTQQDGTWLPTYATYRFNYVQAEIGRPTWSEDCVNFNPYAQVQKLDSVVFPDDPTAAGEGTTKYTFRNRGVQSRNDDNGLLYEAILPTGAKIKWHWDQYDKPNETGSEVAPFLAASRGVSRREVYSSDSDQTADATWTYFEELDDNYIDEGPIANPGDTDIYPREMKTKVTAPDGSVTVSYYTISGDWAPTPMWASNHYGRPYTRYHSMTQPSGEKVWLSTVTYPAGATIDPKVPLQNALRATYVRYETDPTGGSPSEINPRVASTRVVTPRSGPADYDWTDTDHTNFDGLGHYRTTTVTGSDGKSKVTTTSYNPARGTFPGTFTMFPSASNWITNTFDSTTVTEGGISSLTEFCFEPSTGFLKQKLVRRGGAASLDLMTVYADTNSDGNADLESRYGSQGNELTGTISACAPPSSSPKYTITHGYSYGVHASSQHANTSSKSLDLVIDPIGIPSASRDVSGLLTTRYIYNPLGQLRTVLPNLSPGPSEAWTEYTYNINAASAPHATVTVTQWSPVNGMIMTEARHYYDSLGRMVQQRTSMLSMQDSGAPWSASMVTYDASGRKATNSVPVPVWTGSWASISPPGSTQWTYDALGRATKIVQPDGSETNIAYTGASKVERRSWIATAGGSAEVTTRETLDGLGRLASVTEDATGLALQTTYGYDQGDRLKHVSMGVQTRTFDYDRAGLLVSETHPESGVTTYEYDAGGNVAKKVNGTSTLAFAYDFGERLVGVLHDADGSGPGAEVLLKEFTFGNSGIDRGRQKTAKRLNYHPELGGNGIATVTETFFYNSDTGRLSSKDTSVGIPGKATRTFTDDYTYDELGATKSITYPGCSACGSAPARTVVNTYQRGLLQHVNGYASNIRYHANGMWAQFSRPNADGTAGPVDIQTLASHGMARPDALSVTGHCASLSITGPVAAKTVQAGESANLSVTAPAGSTFEWYSGTDTLIPNQTGNTLTVPVAQTTTYWARVRNGACTVDSNASVVTVAGCDPVATLNAPSSVNAGGAHTATFTTQQSGTYQWTIGNGTITSGTTGTSITFTAACSGSVTLNVAFTPSCASTATNFPSGAIPIAVPSVDVAASPSSILLGSSSNVTVTIPGTATWAVKWADLAAPVNVTGSAGRTETPAQTTTYSVTHMNGCAASPSWDSATVTVAVAPPAPLTTVATKSGANSVLVSWTKPAGSTIDSYRVERCTTACAAAGNWTLAGTPTAMTFNDTGLAVNAAYVYRVFSVTSGTTSAAAGPRDFASTYVFTNDPLAVPGGQSAVHVSQLRAATDALRSAAGLGAYSYTDTIAAGSPLKALYLTQLRTAINEARSVFAAAAVNFTPPAPAAGNLPPAAHVHELRGGVQ